MIVIKAFRQSGHRLNVNKYFPKNFKIIRILAVLYFFFANKVQHICTREQTFSAKGLRKKEPEIYGKWKIFRAND